MLNFWQGHYHTCMSIHSHVIVDTRRCSAKRRTSRKTRCLRLCNTSYCLCGVDSHSTSVINHRSNTLRTMYLRLILQRARFILGVLFHQVCITTSTLCVVRAVVSLARYALEYRCGRPALFNVEFDGQHFLLFNLFN